MKVAVCPAVTVALVDEPEAGAKLKSWPIPARETVCGLPGALSVTVSAPVMFPLAVGSKNTPIEQLELGGTPLEQLSVSPKLVDD